MALMQFDTFLYKYFRHTSGSLFCKHFACLKNVLSCMINTSIAIPIFIVNSSVNQSINLLFNCHRVREKSSNNNIHDSSRSSCIVKCVKIYIWLCTRLPFHLNFHSLEHKINNNKNNNENIDMSGMRHCRLQTPLPRYTIINLSMSEVA